MVLSGEEIKARQGADIRITPFCEECLNPNSYNLTLHNELLVYEEVVLDVKQPNRFRRLNIPDEGMILTPGQIYLGRTVEHTETHNLVPMIEGRSSIARTGDGTTTLDHWDQVVGLRMLDRSAQVNLARG